MSTKEKFVLLQEDVLPDVLKKVLEAKCLLQKNIAVNMSTACKMVGISRSAFYKYKDSISYYEEDTKKTVATLYFKLYDETGVLVNVLSILSQYHLNILTVNQTIPVDMSAAATIVVRLEDESISMDAILERLKKISGVLSVKKI